MGEQLSNATWFQIAEWLFFILLAFALAALVAVTLRRYLLEREGGGVECYLRYRGGGRRPWRMGYGRYGTDDLRWYRLFSMWPRATATLSRRGLVILERRAPTSAELVELTADLVVIEVGWQAGDGSAPEEPVYEIAMTEEALTGFLSWLESMPPGGTWQP